MSIIIEKVELENIRLHKKVLFEPKDNGITAITGTNGSGKSTIIDSIAWVLYGTKPSGVSKNSSLMKEGTDLKKEKSYVKIQIKVDNKTFVVERRIVSNAGSVECNIWSKDEKTGELSLLSGPAVSHTDPVIRKTLKMDEKGFLAAILVQQKQVDQLISATPKERSQVIEKLTGISSITAALNEARTQHRDMKKLADATSYDEKELENSQKELAQFRTEKEKVEKKKSALQPKIESRRKELEELKNSIQEIEQKVKQSNELSNNISVNKTLLKEKEQQLQKLSSRKKELKKKLSSIGSNVDYEEIKRKLSETKKKKNNKDRKLYELESQIEKNTTTILEGRELVDKSTVKTADAALNGYKRNTVKARKLEEKLKELSTEIAGSRNSISRFQKAIQVISSDESVCPTCLQTVSDSVKAITGLQDEIATVESNIERFNKEQEKTRQSLEKALEAAEKFEKLYETLTEMDELEKNVSIYQLEHNVLLASLAALEKELDSLEKVNSSAERNKEIKDDYDNVLAELVEISDLIDEISKNLNDFEEEYKNIGNVSETKLDGLRRKLDKASEEYTVLCDDYNDLQQEYKVLETKIGYISASLDRLLDEKNKYLKMIENMEVSRKSVEVIEEFRTDRIENSVPVVSRYASDLLTRFTDGKFVELKIDNKFNTTVVLYNGIERSVGMLSGGEYSIVALALRIAISLLLNSGTSSSTLILDEVLVSQDNMRSELILSTIKDVCQGQVIMISHGSNTTEIADKVVELTTW